jgi:hypothetical protein
LTWGGREDPRSGAELGVIKSEVHYVPGTTRLDDFRECVDFAKNRDVQANDVRLGCSVNLVSEWAPHRFTVNPVDENIKIDWPPNFRPLERNCWE